MAGENFPKHDILPIPGGLDPATLEFVLEHLGRIAFDFELPETNKIDLSDPSSIDEYIHKLEEHIQHSDRSVADKEATLKLLKGLIDYYSDALKQARNA